MKQIAIKAGYGHIKSCYAVVNNFGHVHPYGVIRNLTELYDVCVDQDIDVMTIEDQYFTDDNKDTAKVLSRITGNFEAVALLLGKKCTFIPPSLWKAAYSRKTKKEVLASKITGGFVLDLNLASAILIANYLGSKK